VGANDTALGQALAVAHALDPGVRILGIRRQTPAGLVPPDVEAGPGADPHPVRA